MSPLCPLSFLGEHQLQADDNGSSDLYDHGGVVAAREQLVKQLCLRHDL